MMNKEKEEEGDDVLIPYLPPVGCLSVCLKRWTLRLHDFLRMCTEQLIIPSFLPETIKMYPQLSLHARTQPASKSREPECPFCPNANPIVPCLPTLVNVRPTSHGPFHAFTTTFDGQDLSACEQGLQRRVGGIRRYFIYLFIISTTTSQWIATSSTNSLPPLLLQCERFIIK